MLNDLAASMRTDFESGLARDSRIDTQTEYRDGADVHRTIRKREIFKAYSSARCTAQQMVWDVVMDSLEEQREQLNATGKSLMERAAAGGSLELDPELEIPRYVEAVDVHLMPGCYYREYGGEDLAAGAIYDQGLNVFSFGAMGKDLSDIGWSMANFYKDFRDQDPRQLTITAGFPADGYLEGVMPRYTYTDEEDFITMAVSEPEFGEDTGRLSDVIFWYGFGSVKQG